jgi:CelD/BcsL family acetyltransferase involved in cellulose biosynthesis
VKHSGFDDVRVLWHAKEPAGEIDNLFQSYDWNRTWWEVFGQGKELLLWTVGDPHEPNILPLYRTSRRARRLPALPFQEVLLVGTGESLGTDYVDIVATRDEPKTDLLVRWEEEMKAAGERWDVLNLLDVRPDSRALRMCLEWQSQRRNPVLVSARFDCPYVDLPDTLEEYRDTVMSRSVRRVIANKWNRLRRDFRVDVRFTGDGCPPERLFDDFVFLHQARWQGQGAGGKFSDPRYLDFHRRMWRRAHARDSLFIANLYLDGEPAAAQYGYVFKGRYYYWQAGRRPGLDRYSPGLLLFYKIIEELFARKLRGMEMLRGAHAYKLHFATRTVQTLQVRVYNRHRARAIALYALDALESLARRLTPAEGGL